MICRTEPNKKTKTKRTEILRRNCPIIKSVESVLRSVKFFYLFCRSQDDRPMVKLKKWNGPVTKSKKDTFTLDLVNN